MKVYLFSLVLSVLSCVTIVGMATAAQNTETASQRNQRQLACNEGLLKTIGAGFAATH